MATTNVIAAAPTTTTRVAETTGVIPAALQKARGQAILK